MLTICILYWAVTAVYPSVLTTNDIEQMHTAVFGSCFDEVHLFSLAIYQLVNISLTTMLKPATLHPLGNQSIRLFLLKGTAPLPTVHARLRYEWRYGAIGVMWMRLCSTMNLTLWSRCSRIYLFAGKMLCIGVNNTFFFFVRSSTEVTFPNMSYVKAHSVCLPSTAGRHLTITTSSGFSCPTYCSSFGWPTSVWL